MDKTLAQYLTEALDRYEHDTGDLVDASQTVQAFKEMFVRDFGTHSLETLRKSLEMSE